MFCDVLTPDGETPPTPAACSSACSTGSGDGLTCLVEFYLLESSSSATAPRAVDHESYFDRRHRFLRDFRRKAVTMLEEVGISVENSATKPAPDERNRLRHDALQTADNVMTFTPSSRKSPRSYVRNLHAQALHQVRRQRHTPPSPSSKASGILRSRCQM